MGEYLLKLSVPAACILRFERNLCIAQAPKVSAMSALVAARHVLSHEHQTDRLSGSIVVPETEVVVLSLEVSSSGLESQGVF